MEHQPYESGPTDEYDPVNETVRHITRVPDERYLLRFWVYVLSLLVLFTAVSLFLYSVSKDAHKDLQEQTDRMIDHVVDTTSSYGAEPYDPKKESKAFQDTILYRMFIPYAWEWIGGFVLTGLIVWFKLCYREKHLIDTLDPIVKEMEYKMSLQKGDGTEQNSEYRSQEPGVRSRKGTK